MSNSKKVIKKVLSSSFLFPSIRKMRRSGAIVLMYHNIHNDTDTNFVNVSIHIKEFEQQIKFFKKYFNIISLADLVKKIKQGSEVKSNTMVLTFDDGYRNHFTLLYPLLVKYELHATIFLVADFINTDRLLWTNLLDYLLKTTFCKRLLLKVPENGSYEFCFNTSESRIKSYEKIKRLLKHLEPEVLNLLMSQIEGQLGSKSMRSNCLNYIMMQKEDLKAMDSKYVELGSHGCSHHLLTTIKFKKILEKEIIESKKKIGQIVGYEPRFFCYPEGDYGDYNDQIIQLVKQHYTGAVTAIYGSINKKTRLFNIPRIAAMDDMLQLKWELLRV